MESIIDFAAALPGVVAVTAGPETGAPESAWGDTFLFYDPADDPHARQFPFATVVTRDYAGFDELSRLDRDGVYRVNIAVGRDRFHALIGHAPSAHAEHHGAFDYAELDVLLPHPSYSQQAWVCVVCPSLRTTEQVRGLIAEAGNRAARHHRAN
ncbi:DUF6194 family protein [Tomitella biformata]|uniref:DUF6194 family protein n=1 Tax=Tomitella biformata TaxID=630403 RepID=UPI0004665257|nr:DUF6194 family protein [Tomitella biformata]